MFVLSTVMLFLYRDQAACTLRSFSKTRPRAKRCLPEEITLQDSLCRTTDQTFIALPESARPFLPLD